MNQRGKMLTRLCAGWGDILQPIIPWANVRALLAATAEVESNFGAFAVPRHERAYDFTGTYVRRDLLERHGSLAACSYSSFQILYVVAVELGFDATRTPVDLHSDEVAVLYVAEYVRKRIVRPGASSIRDFADAYNSGSHKDSLVPLRYIERFESAYESALPVVESW